MYIGWKVLKRTPPAMCKAKISWTTAEKVKEILFKLDFLTMEVQLS